MIGGREKARELREIGMHREQKQKGEQSETKVKGWKI